MHSAMTVPKGLAASIEETKVEYRTLAKSSLRISNPVLGYYMGFRDPDWFN